MTKGCVLPVLIVSDSFAPWSSALLFLAGSSSVKGTEELASTLRQEGVKSLLDFLASGNYARNTGGG